MASSPPPGRSKRSCHRPLAVASRVRVAMRSSSRASPRRRAPAAGAGAADQPGASLHAAPRAQQPAARAARSPRQLRPRASGLSAPRWSSRSCRLRCTVTRSPSARQGVATREHVSGSRPGAIDARRCRSARPALMRAISAALGSSQYRSMQHRRMPRGGAAPHRAGQVRAKRLPAAASTAAPPRAARAARPVGSRRRRARCVRAPRPRPVRCSAARPRPSRPA